LLETMLICRWFTSIKAMSLFVKKSAQFDLIQFDSSWNVSCYLSLIYHMSSFRLIGGGLIILIVICPLVFSQNYDISFVHLGALLMKKTIIFSLAFYLIWISFILFAVFMNHLDIGFDGIDPTGNTFITAHHATKQLVFSLFGWHQS
jgi:hypothetical protein